MFLWLFWAELLALLEIPPVSSVRWGLLEWSSSAEVGLGASPQKITLRKVVAKIRISRLKKVRLGRVERMK